MQLYLRCGSACACTYGRTVRTATCVHAIFWTCMWWLRTHSTRIDVHQLFFGTFPRALATFRDRQCRRSRSVKACCELSHHDLCRGCRRALAEAAPGSSYWRCCVRSYRIHISRPALTCASIRWIDPWPDMRGQISVSMLRYTPISVARENCPCDSSST